MTSDSLPDQAFIARSVESCGNMVSGLGEHGLASSLWALASRIRATAAQGHRYTTDGIEDLIEASSLGTPGARALRARTSPEAAADVRRRAAQRETIAKLTETPDDDLRDALVLIGAEKRARLRAFLEEAGQ